MKSKSAPRPASDISDASAVRSVACVAAEPLALPPPSRAIASVSGVTWPVPGPFTSDARHSQWLPAWPQASTRQGARPVSATSA